MKRLLTALDISDLSNSLIRFSFSFSIKHDIGHIDFIHVKEEEPGEMKEVPVKGYTLISRTIYNYAGVEIFKLSIIRR